jgi:hypothetical protein
MTHVIDTVFIDAILSEVLRKLGLPERLPLIKLSPRMQEWIIAGADRQYMETWFADTYPTYVSEDGSEVKVSEEQLQSFIESSVKLVGWLASELRTRELAHIKAEGMSPQ